MSGPAWGFVWLVAWPDLRARIRRFLVIGLGMSIVLAITLLMSAFSEGFNLRADRLLDVFDADVYLVADGAAGPLSSTSPFDASVVEDVADEPGVTSATPLLLTPNAVLVAGRPVSLMLVATPPDAAWPAIAAGRAIAGPGEAVVDEELAEFALGDEFVLAGRTIEVVGTTRHATWDVVTAAMFIDRSEALELFAGGRDVATSVILEGELLTAPDGLTVQTRGDAFDDLLSRMDDAKRSIDAFRVTMWALAVVIVGAVLYLASVERIGDFAIFKATGASDRDLVLGLALQAAMLGLIAGLMSIGLAHAMMPIYPGLLSLPARIAWLVLPVAVLIAVLSSFVGIRRAMKVDPSQAFG